MTHAEITSAVREIAGACWDDREDRTSPLADQIRAVAAIAPAGTDGDLTDEDRHELRRLADAAQEAPPLTYRVGCDSGHDLRSADLSSTDAACDSMWDAWREAVAAIAEATGLDITPVRTTYQSTHELETTTRHEAGLGGGLVEAVIWQAAHDAISEREDGEWRYRGAIPSSDVRRIVEADGRARRLAAEAE